MAAVFAVAALLLPAKLGFASETWGVGGEWSEEWAEELEPLRRDAFTWSWRMAYRAHTYYIPFEDRDTFERYWPLLLSLKSKGGRLVLRSVETELDDPSILESSTPDLSAPWSIRFSESETLLRGCLVPHVRILAPFPDGWASLKLKVGPPWPEYVLSPSGELPEYVRVEEVNGKKRWAASQTNTGPGWCTRARIDLELILDGETINLNRIPLPADTLIVDERRLGNKHEDPNQALQTDREARGG